MDTQTREQLLASGFKRIEMPMAEGSYEAMETTFAFNDAEIQLDPDLMHIRFILCHEGTNANGDYFTKEVLKTASLTPKNKPVDWEHGQPIIGVMLDSFYKEDAISGRGYIEAVGVVWKFIYPELSGSIKSKAATGELKMSMECYFKDANYKVGDTLYTQEQASELGIIPYVGRAYMGQQVTRVFNEVLFGGVGVVSKPADKEAIFLSVARDLNSHGIATGTETPEELSTLSSVIADAITRTVNDFKNKTITSEDLGAVTVAKYVKAFDKAKGSIVSQFNKDELKTKDQLVLQVRSALNTFLQEVSVISQDYYLGVANELDKSEAKDLFFSEIRSSLSMQVYSHFADLSDDSLEAYLLEVAEDYFIYELIDYSKSYPESTRIFKSPYVISEDSKVVADLSILIEVEQVYVEKSLAGQINTIEEVIEEMAKENTPQATQEELMASVASLTTNLETSQAKADEFEAKASELQGKFDSLTEELRVTNEAKASLETEVATMKSKLDEVEATKVAEARLTELTGLGITLSEARQAKLKGMSDSDYTDFKELLVEVAGKTVVESASAVAVSEEEITVEGAKASAGLNVEQEVTTRVNPFGHLSS